MSDMQKYIDEIRKILPDKIAEELCSVQPMPNNIDFDALANYPLWISFVARHMSPSDGGEDKSIA